MSRSGTESLCKALEILGIPTYHGWRSMENHKQSQLWVEAMQAKYENKGKAWKREDFDQILGDYSVSRAQAMHIRPVQQQWTGMATINLTPPFSGLHRLPLRCLSRRID